MMMTGSSLTQVIVGLLVLIVIFLAIREIVCWYWKINRMVELLESIDAHLRDRGSPQ